MVAAKRHEITILTRNVRSDRKTSSYLLFPTNVTQKVSQGDGTPGVTWLAVNYNDKNDLVEALRGIHTVLSFVNQPPADLEDNSQKNLIDASIAAGVKRFAPSEYGR